MICIAFYFLLRPGEYTGTTNDDAAFRLDDVSLFLGSRKLNLTSAPDRELEAATSTSLYFTTQKNQRKGDSIAHGKSLHPLCCPVRSITRFVLRHRTYYRRNGRPLDLRAKLATYYNNNKLLCIRAVDITKQLRFSATALETTTGIQPARISARSLRAGGAMALLCAHTDKETIKLLGRWHSDAMMQYLHQDCLPVMNRLARKMYNNGKYSFLPSQTVPTAVPATDDDTAIAAAPATAALSVAPDGNHADPSETPDEIRRDPPRRSLRVRGLAPAQSVGPTPLQLQPHNRPPERLR